MTFSGFAHLSAGPIERELRAEVQSLKETIAKLEQAPLTVFTIAALTSEGRGIAAGSPPVEISLPAGAKLGSQIRCRPETSQGYDLLPEPVCFGPVVEVTGLEDGWAVVKANAQEYFLPVADGARLTVGARAVLDNASMVVLKALEADEAGFAPSVAQSVSWDDIGGQDEAKEALREALEYPTLHAELYAAHGQKPAKGALLYGPPGCVEGDAVVTINRGGAARNFTLREVVDRFHGPRFSDLRRSSWAHTSSEQGRCVRCDQIWPCASQRRRDRAPGGRVRAWDPAIPTLIRCYINGEFRLRRLIAAYPKGTKPVLRVVLADGKALRVTADHEIAQPGDKWTRADALSPGMRVLTNGAPAAVAPDHELTRYLHKGYWIICRGLARHPSARRTPHGGYEMPEHRLVAEARLNGHTLAEWLELSASGALPTGARFLSSRDNVHHKDHDTTNNAPDNLVVKTKLEHAREHAVEDQWHRHIPVFIAKETEVVSIEPAGETEVFDLTVDEAHNFVANGIVVHNCGKTHLARALATSLGGDTAGFIYVKATEVMSRWQGQSGKTVRDLFKQGRDHQAKTGKRAILFIDEADSLLPVRDGGGVKVGAGVEDMVPVFLAEMDGLNELGPFVLLATNRPDRIDPAVLRDGRCETKVHVARPDESASHNIFSLALRGRRHCAGMAKHGATELFSDRLILLELTYPGVRTSEYLRLRDLVSGAMIEGIVQRAAGLAIKRDRASGELSAIGTDDIDAAIKLTLRQQARLNHDAVIAEISRAFGKSPERVRKVVA